MKFTPKYFATATKEQLENDINNLVEVNRICQIYLDSNGGSFLGTLSMKAEINRNNAIIASIRKELARRAR